MPASIFLAKLIGPILPAAALGLLGNEITPSSCPRKRMGAKIRWVSGAARSAAEALVDLASSPSAVRCRPGTVKARALAVPDQRCTTRARSVSEDPTGVGARSRCTASGTHGYLSAHARKRASSNPGELGASGILVARNGVPVGQARRGAPRGDDAEQFGR